MKKYFLSLILVSFLVTGCAQNPELVKNICTTTGGICNAVTMICGYYIDSPGICNIGTEVCKYANAICVSIEANVATDSTVQQLEAVQSTLQYYSKSKVFSAKGVEIALDKALTDVKGIYASIDTVTVDQ